MRNMKKVFYLVVIFALTWNETFPQPSSMIVDVSKPIATVQPTMWGIFFEDINFGADGGLYAELVKNRSFEFNVPLMGWEEQNKGKFSVNKESGYIMVINHGAKDQSNPRFARVNVNADKGYGLTNEGFRGMGIKKNMTYTFSLLSSQLLGATKIHIELVDAKGNILGDASLAPSGSEWKKYVVIINANDT